MDNVLILQNSTRTGLFNWQDFYMQFENDSMCTVLRLHPWPNISITYIQYMFNSISWTQFPSNKQLTKNKLYNFYHLQFLVM